MAFTAPPGSSGAGRRYFDMKPKKYIISIGWGIYPAKDLFRVYVF
jgi:hypothetical protein